MFTILGAGGAIGNELVKELTPRNEAIRLVSRNPTLIPGAAEAIAADLSNRDDTLKVVSGSRIVFLVIGLRYEIKVCHDS
jgi:putative NADH-flavin reductase